MGYARRNRTRYRTLDVVNADDRVQEVFEDGDGIWLWLVCGNGWTAERGGAHDIHEDTAGAVLARYRGLVRCDCDECAKGKR
jgi:hypothetical protein